MNIAILIPELGGGGAERVSQIIGNYYVGKGHNVYYFLADMPVKQVYNVKGKVIYTGIKSCTEDNSFGYLQILAKLIKSSYRVRILKKRYKIDVAISFMEEFNYINILSKGREKVVTRICTVLSGVADFSGELYNKYMISFFYGRSSKIIVMSNDARNDMHSRYGVSLKKIFKIPNPVLSPDVNDLNMEWEYGEKVIVTIGRLSLEKQQERIIRAFSYVNKYEDAARLLIMGEGNRIGYLKGICRKYGLEDKVIFTGFRSNVSHYLKNSKVFIMASEVEGFPNSMLEAMTCGVPVVTTDSPGGCGEIVGKRNITETCRDIQYCTYGILTPYISGKLQLNSELEREELLLGKAMLEVLNNKKLYEKYSRLSLKRASMYNIEKVMKKWDKLLF